MESPFANLFTRPTSTVAKLRSPGRHMGAGAATDVLSRGRDRCGGPMAGPPSDCPTAGLASSRTPMARGSATPDQAKECLRRVREGGDGRPESRVAGRGQIRLRRRDRAGSRNETQVRNRYAADPAGNRRRDIPRGMRASRRPMLSGQLVHRSTTRWSPDVARRSRARPCGDVTAGEREPGGNPGLSRSGMQERPPSSGTGIAEPNDSATREATASRSAIGSTPAYAGPHGRCPRVRRPASRAGYAVSGGQRLVDWACGSPADVSGSSAGNITGMSPGSPPARMAMALVLSNGETS